MSVIEFNYKPTPKQAEAHSDSHLELGYGGAVGGGKTLFMCAEAFTLCCQYPGNRGYLCRKVGKHFKETTLQTWIGLIPHQAYKINEQKQEIRVLTTPNSVIYYGGLNNREDMDRFSSGEFGFVGIDQAEEAEEKDFTALLGRLRLKLPNGTFPHYRGIFTANPKICYFRDRFIINPNPAVQKFIQALPSDNPFLPQDYIERLRELYKNRPELMKALIEGSWNILEGTDVVIKSDWVSKSQGNESPGVFMDKIGVSVDPARFGDDETVIYGWIGAEPTEQLIYGHTDLHVTASRALALCKKIHGNFIVVDGDGVGGGVIDILNNMLGEDTDIQVIEFRGSQRAEDNQKFYNRRAEAYWGAGELMANGTVKLPPDKVLAGQLSGVKYTYASGRILIDPKEDIKKELGRSPDRSDAIVMGLWGLNRAQSIRTYKDEGTATAKWVEQRKRELGGLGGSYEDMEV